MSKAETCLAKQIFEDSFTGDVAEVANFLMTYGPKTLTLICKGCKLRISRVREALKVLMQHHFVTLLPVDVVVYKITNEAVLNLLRYPHYVQLVGKKLGVDAQVLVEQIIKSGELAVSKLLYFSGCEILESNPDLADSLYDKINSLYHTIKLLAEFRFIIQSPEAGKEEETLATVAAAADSADGNYKDTDANDSLFVVPTIDLNQVVEEIKKQEKGNVDSFPDSLIYFKVYFKKFMEKRRNELVLAALARKYRPIVDSKLFEVMIDLGFAKYPWEKESAPVSINEIADVIRKALGDVPLTKYIDEHFEILEQDPLRIFTKLGNTFGGQFVFSMKEAFTHIMWHTLERIITERHGYHAARIFRLIKENDFVEQERIQELGMIPAKEAKHLTYKLVNDRCVFIKEVRKNYSVGGVPGKVVYLFHVDLNQAVLALMESCYKAMVNCKTREKREVLKNCQLLRKDDRITRILAKMKSQQCTDEQMQEIQELITPPERAVLLRHESRTTQLISGVLHLDETIFIMQMYLFYNRKKPLPKTGRSRQKQTVAD